MSYILPYSCIQRHLFQGWLITSLAQAVNIALIIHVSLRVNWRFHLVTTGTTFRITSLRRTLSVRCLLVCHLTIRLTSNNANGIPPYANPQFDASFAESYLKFAMALNPNAKFDPNDITPHWDTWQGANEMLFNHTEAGVPVIKQIRTSTALLERCA